MLRQLREAVRATKTVELRLDWLRDDREISCFLRNLRPPHGTTCLATCRRRSAGGRYRGSIARQLVHLADAIRAGCTWYDLEVESSSLCPPELVGVLLGQAKRLASAHFFKAMPANLSRVARQLGQNHPHGIKIAAHCESFAQWRKLSQFGARRQATITIPMGDTVQPARILALRERNGFAYAPVDNVTAPGQVSLSDAVNVYRGDRITRRTPVYGVIGDPIAHSLSPQMQNAGFRARQMDAIYLPFLVRDLRDFLAAAGALGLRGFSVTIPHKERILAFLGECDPLAKSIGAVNTVVVRGKGKFYGYNTDYVGVLRALERRVRLQGSRILIVGAGGVARAVAFALARSGASVCVCARREKQARKLAQAVDGSLVERARLRREFFDAIINATPVGMHPFAGHSPLEARDLNCRLVFDTIYRPRVTKLLQLAERRGIETVSGLEMFLAQGTAQWEIWTGQRAPLEAMRSAVLAALRKEERARSASQ